MTETIETKQPGRNPWIVRSLVVALILVIAVGACAGPSLITPPPSDEATSEAEGEATSGDSSAPAQEGAATATEQPVADSQAADASPPGPIHPVADEPTESYKGIPVGFTADGFPYRGSPDAPIVMIEYSDFQCPFCSRYFVQTEPALDEAYVRDGQVRVVFHDFPLEGLHPNAPTAHAASLCVADQGSAAQYWEMHAELFRSVEEWESSTDPVATFTRLADEIGADVERLTACLADEEMAATVQERVDAAAAAGFSGTPSFQFVRAEDGATFELVGAQPFDQFSNLIDAVLSGETPQTAQAEDSGGGDNEIPYWAIAEGLQPDPDRPGYNMAGDLYRGNVDAPVVIVEFSDFQCPFCKSHTENTQPALDEAFVDTGKVMWVFKHFPLNIHPQAPAAGVASECAAEQGQFWEMHHLIFENQSAWSISEPNDVFIELAEDLTLDMAAFTACLDDPDIAARIQSDYEDGTAYVRGTPTFIVLYNGQGSIIPGALPEERFTEVLNQILAEVESS